MINRATTVTNIANFLKDNIGTITQDNAYYNEVKEFSFWLRSKIRFELEKTYSQVVFNDRTTDVNCYGKDSCYNVNCVSPCGGQYSNI
jgi:hypothetical protein